MDTVREELSKCEETIAYYKRKMTAAFRKWMMNNMPEQEMQEEIHHYKQWLDFERETYKRMTKLLNE